MLESSRSFSEDGGKDLVFRGQSAFAPVKCDKELFMACPFKSSLDGKAISSRGTVSCEHCGKAHVPGSLSGRTCREWASFKRAYREMRVELPGKRKFYIAGTKTAVFSDDCDEFLRRRLWNKVKISILRRDAFTCQDCGRSSKELARGKNWQSALEVHHIVPRSLGGTEHPGNLKTVCVECHRSYTNETIGLMRSLRLEEKLMKRNCGCDGTLADADEEAEVDDMAFE